MSELSSQRLALAPWIGLCPLLALAQTSMSGLALGLGVLAMGIIALPALALVRRGATALRWPLTAIALSAAAGCAQMLVDAGMYSQHETVAWGIPLLAANLPLWRAVPPFDAI